MNILPITITNAISHDFIGCLWYQMDICCLQHFVLKDQVILWTHKLVLISNGGAYHQLLLRSPKGQNSESEHGIQERQPDMHAVDIGSESTSVGATRGGPGPVHQ